MVGWNHMRRAGVLAAMLSAPAARADWLAVTAGVAGSAAPTAADEFWFDTPHGPPQVAINRVTGGTVGAHAGGSSSYFGGLGVPVLLTLADGSAYLAGGDPPAAATGRGPGGGAAGPRSSQPPVSGVAVPSTAALLGVEFGDPSADGSRTLSVSLRDGQGMPLGDAAVNVPDGGWWVIGLGPDQPAAPSPEPATPPTGGGTPEPVSTPGVPEPGTVALAVAGLAAAGLVPGRRRACRG